MMNKNSLISEIDVSSPVDICIEIKGHLDKRKSDILGGLSIRNTTTSENIYISFIEGIVIDQAALIGIINTLFNMRYPIVNVIIKDKSKQADT